jgi:hypothetical protein
MKLAQRDYRELMRLLDSNQLDLLRKRIEQMRPDQRRSFFFDDALAQTADLIHRNSGTKGFVALIAYCALGANSLALSSSLATLAPAKMRQSTAYTKR